MSILGLIDSIRNSFPEAEKVYTEGSCYQFHLILKSVYPEAQPWYDGIVGHVITKLGPKYYDVTGALDHKPHWYPLDREPRILAEAAEWRFEGKRTPTLADKLWEAIKPRDRDDEATKTMKQILLKGRISMDDRRKLIDELMDGR